VVLEEYQLFGTKYWHAGLKEGQLAAVYNSYDFFDLSTDIFNFSSLVSCHNKAPKHYTSVIQI
jgi:hypothetical protein